MKALLLNSTYEPISFISERRAIKLYVKDKVEVLSSWDSYIHGDIRLPALVRLVKYVRWVPKKSRFNRMGLFKRDRFTCMYCGKQLKAGELTIDHIIPKSQGGKLNWENCVSACFACNSKKGDRTPEEAGMVLIKSPAVPRADLVGDLCMIDVVHPDWGQYVKIG